ncbi:MAG: UDP-N-acetyl glucosamine 2-epimerase [Deltaproteobacteria bacterium]|nr:UDP-N-acetyl glucosamine 2-epimerase [Deltaproteobacteria bacterium]
MSETFFHELEIPKPDINLEVGSASHAYQTAEIMKRFEPVLLDYQPDVVVLVGDVNSTMACALVASKIQYSTPNSPPTGRAGELITLNSRRKPWAE